MLNNQAGHSRWWNDPATWLELFVLGNISFLAVDVYIAHSINSFRVWTQWVPVVFSLVSPVFLAAGMIGSGMRPRRGSAGHWLGLAVGWGSILVGVAGLILHLESAFFEQQTLKNLVYTAPFVAPLSYTGLGLLLVMNRMVARGGMEWAQWVALLALGGFAGNFVLSLADHAQNGFFNTLEWVPVVTAALAVGFFGLLVLVRVNTGYLGVCGGVLMLQAVVGVMGFALHLWHDVTGPMNSMVDDFLYGAPIFAPLLFVNLALLGAIGLWAMLRATRIGNVAATSGSAVVA